MSGAICKMSDQMKDLKLKTYVLSIQKNYFQHCDVSFRFVLLEAHNLYICLFKNLQCFYTVMELALAGVAFHSCRFYDVARVLIADSRVFQALAAILDCDILSLDVMLVSFRCRTR